MKISIYIHALIVVGMVLSACLVSPSQAAGKIAFHSARGGLQQIYSMNSDGSNQAAVTLPGGGEESTPSWSPDGKKLAFAVNGGISVVNADGTGGTVLASGNMKQGPHWSRDGSKILYSSFFSSDWDIFVMNADGTGAVRTIANRYGDYVGNWSPDGSKIAFTTFINAAGDDSAQIYVANANGTGQVLLTSGAHNADPYWSPDGSKIVFQSRRDGGAKEIYIMNSDGTGQTRLTNNSAADIQPCFSPDGTQIAFVSQRDGNSEIYVMNVDGSNQTRLTFNPGMDEVPDWVNPVPSGAPTLSVSSPTVTEADSGANSIATFTLSLSAAFSQPVTLTYSTTNNTATAPEDYIALPPAMVTFAPGETTKTVDVTIVGDDTDEPEESFRLSLTGLTNASAAAPYGTATIQDNGDAVPTVSIGDASVLEGDSGTTTLSFPVTLSASSGYAISVNAATASGTGSSPALSGSDFTAKTGTVTIPAGSTSGTFQVSITGDTQVEKDETFFVTLSSPVRAGIGRAQATGTILRDDFPRLTVTQTSTNEGHDATDSGSATFTATLSATTDADVTFDYTTVDGTAVAGTDYVATTGTLTIPAGELSKTIVVPFIGDKLDEDNETFLLRVTNLANAVLPPAANAPLFNSGNGHYYELINTALNFEQAKNAAAARSFRGVTGHLATITTAQEANFLLTSYPNRTFWLGGFQPAGSVEPLGGWSWVTGEPFTYANWYPGQPDNQGNENALHLINPYGINDIPATDSFHYLVEYDSPPPSEGVGEVFATITDDDSLPILSIADISVQESSGTNTTATLTVKLSGATSKTVTVNYYSADGTATSPADYNAVNNTLTFAPGDTTKTINLTVKGDVIAEGTEAFSLYLSGAANATIPNSPATVSILDDEYRPAVGTATPASGATAAGASRSISTTSTDANGATDITVVRLLINGTLTPANALYGYYDQAANKLYLFNDAGTSIMGGFAPGSANVISNSQGRLDCAQTTVSANGNTLTVNWSFTPASGFTGIKNLYGLVRDVTGQTDGFKDIGNWSIGVANSAPLNSGVTPSSSTTAIAVTHTLSTAHTDVDGAADINQARLLVNNALSSVNGIHAIYDRPQNKLFLFNDAGTALTGGFAPGSANVITNGQGSLDCAATTVTETGNTFTVSWAITPTNSFSGAKNLYMLSRDASGAVAGWDNKGTWTIQTVAPSVGEATPASGNSSPGTARSISVTYSDANGANDISQVRLLVNSSLTASNGLYGLYDRVSNKLYLFNDSGTSIVGGFAPGSANTISNSQGSLNCETTTVSMSGNVLTVTWNFTPASGFTGTRNLYGLVRDSTGLADGFDVLGTWTVAGANAPHTANILPASGTSAAGTERELRAVYTDNDGGSDIVQARVLVNSTLSGANAIQALYDKTSNKLYLFNDAGTALLGGFAPGSPNVITNSQGSLNCEATTVLATGPYLVIEWMVTPTASFAGDKNLYLACRDASGTAAGWDSRGTWTINSTGGLTAPQSIVAPSDAAS